MGLSWPDLSKWYVFGVSTQNDQSEFIVWTDYNENTSLHTHKQSLYHPIMDFVQSEREKRKLICDGFVYVNQKVLAVCVLF